jgi:hypothetical protein
MPSLRPDCKAINSSIADTDGDESRGFVAVLDDVGRNKVARLRIGAR